MKVVVFSFSYLVDGDVGNAVGNARKKFIAEWQAAGTVVTKTALKKILTNARIAIYATGEKK